MRQPQRAARQLLEARGVDRWPFPAVSALFDLLCALKLALVDKRRDEFIRDELNANHQLDLPLPSSLIGPYSDDDVPF